MQGLTLFNLNLTHLLDAFLETAVPMIAGLAEVVGLFIIITSLAKATFYYVRATFFNDHRDFHHEMSSGLTTALEFLMSAEIATEADDSGPSKKTLPATAAVAVNEALMNARRFMALLRCFLNDAPEWGVVYTALPERLFLRVKA